MVRWQHTKDLDENADRNVLQTTIRAIYKALIKYLNRSQLPWSLAEAKIDLLQPEPVYNEIRIDNIVTYADEQLLDECTEAAIRHATHTFSDSALAVIEIGIERSDRLGSFSYLASFLEPEIEIEQLVSS